jgi:hypothetical protein
MSMDAPSIDTFWPHVDPMAVSSPTQPAEGAAQQLAREDP